MEKVVEMTEEWKKKVGRISFESLERLFASFARFTFPSMAVLTSTAGCSQLVGRQPARRLSVFWEMVFTGARARVIKLESYERAFANRPKWEKKKKKKKIFTRKENFRRLIQKLNGMEEQSKDMLLPNKGSGWGG